MRPTLLVLSTFLISSLFALPPASSESLTFDYTLTYTITPTATTFSVDGVFTSHPECIVPWAVSAPTTTSTADPAQKRIYRVNLALGIIEERDQNAGIVTTRTLTCSLGAMTVINPVGVAEFGYSIDCSSTTRTVKTDLTTNPRFETSPSTAISWFGYSTEDLWTKANSCLVNRASGPSGQLPYTGYVYADYIEMDCKWYPTCTFGGVVESLCTPLHLAGIPIGPAPEEAIRTCNNRVAPPPQDDPQDRYQWFVASYSHTNGGLPGIGWYAGEWKTS